MTEPDVIIFDCDGPAVADRTKARHYPMPLPCPRASVTRCSR
jgi:hypothetical protein